MNTIKNIRNRLSLSVDKISPTRGRSPPPDRNSCHLASAPPSERSIPADLPATPKRPKRDRSRASRLSSSSRHSSLVRSPTGEVSAPAQEVTFMEGEATADKSEVPPVEECSKFLDQSFDGFQEFTKALSKNEPHSLMEEVMKEVEKISTITESIENKGKPDKSSGTSDSLLRNKEVQNRRDKSGSNSQRNSKDESEIIGTSDDNLNTITSTSSSSSLTHDKTQSSKVSDRHAVESTCTILSTASTLHAESLTSGYFSDSASEDIGNSEAKDRQIRSKTASPIQRMFKLSKHDKGDKEDNKSSVTPTDKKDASKKESIYSRLIKSTKRDPSTSRSPKEPIYARIKPKLKLETSFKPIEPIVSKEDSKQSSLLVKPEPIYSKVKSKPPSSPEQQSTSSPVVSISSGNPSSPFTPISSVLPEAELSKEPIYSSIKPKKEKTRTLPLEALYSRIRKKDSHTLPKDATPPIKDSVPPLSKDSISSPMELTSSPKESTSTVKDASCSAKTKEPIYNQPLPALPFESQNNQRKYEFLCNSGVDSAYGKVTVKAKEISPVSPSKPSVITIYNPGYAQTLSSAASTTPTTTPPVSPTTTSSPQTFYTGTVSPAKSNTHSPIEDPAESLQLSTISLDTGSKDTLNMSQSTLGHEEGTNGDIGSSSKLNRLVEELAQELDNVAQNANETYSKKDVLTRLLSTYDVPKNLRRVNEADESDLRQTEGPLLSAATSGDELRFMDDDENMETVYADVPDYSQDEFVIALDDENDPKYASLTQAMRRKNRGGGESPGKVSRKSAQVYVNVVNVISALKVLINSNSTKAATVINRMGTLARPYAKKVHSSISDNSNWIQRKINHKSGHNGFDELRRYIKSGGEFCKELAIIMHERAELEASYAKGLHKLSARLVKGGRDTIGSVGEAWQAVGAELEHEGDIHRILAASLSEDVVRPLRQQIETQHKIRKGVEALVDKASKNLQEWKAAEVKAKKNCYHNTRENEKVQDMMIEARLGRGKAMSEKDLVKLEKQRRKAEEAVQKSDIEYYNYCVRTERARQEWESAVYKGSNCFQTLEEERLSSLKTLVLKYHKTNKEAAPKLVSCAGRLDEPVAACDVEKDIQAVIVAKGTGENIPEQFLPDFYSEDLNNLMNKARRREALEKFVKLIRGDLDRERRGKQGVENLAKALQETPNFGGEDSQQDVNDKLQNMKAMLAYLEASRFKVQSSLDEINNRPRSSHPLAKHIETHRDKQGFPVSILKVPPWVRGNSTDVSPLSESPTSGSPNWNDRGAADGTSVQPDSDFVPNDFRPPSVEPPRPHVTEGPPGGPRAFMYPARYPSLVIPTDEFSSQGSDPDYQMALTIGTQSRQPEAPDGAAVTVPDAGGGPSPPDGTYYARPLPSSGAALHRCKALYDYEANMYDELSINTGDIILIHEKQPDGWWVGELEGQVGIFPATYVEEID